MHKVVPWRGSEIAAPRDDLFGLGNNKSEVRMKKIFLGMLFSALIAGSVWAETGPTEEDYRNLDQMREKLVRMKQEMAKFMNDVIGPYADMGKGGVAPFAQDVRLDIAEGEKSFTVKADLPGMDKDKIDVRLDDGRVLTISGNREIVTKQESPGIVRQERSIGSFERSIALPAECDNEGIEATYKEGVLEIILSKKKMAKEDSVKVKVR